MNCRKFFCCVLASISSFFVFGQQRKETNYLIYHDWINKAESFYFLEKNYDSAAFYYKRAFKEFDFVFVKDCIIAAELAAVNKKKDDFLAFSLRGFDRGWKLSDMKELQYSGYGGFITVHVFDAFLSDKAVHAQLTAEYPQRRQKYLAGIDTNILMKQVNMFMLDELNKNLRKIESWEERKQIHAAIVKENARTIDSIIKAKAFPGEKLVGVTDDHLLGELGKKGMDPIMQYDNYYYRFMDSMNIERDMFWEGRFVGTNEYLYVLLVHNRCSYIQYQPYFQKAVKDGNIHPRDIAYLLDFSLYDDHPGDRTRRYQHAKKYLSCIIDTTAMRNYTSGSNAVEAPQAAYYDINQYRQKWHIAPIEVDVAKRKYEVEAGVRLFFGFFDHL